MPLEERLRNAREVWCGLVPQCKLEPEITQAAFTSFDAAPSYFQLMLGGIVERAAPLMQTHRMVSDKPTFSHSVELFALTHFAAVPQLDAFVSRYHSYASQFEGFTLFSQWLDLVHDLAEEKSTLQEFQPKTPESGQEADGLKRVLKYARERAVSEEASAQSHLMLEASLHSGIAVEEMFGSLTIDNQSILRILQACTPGEKLYRRMSQKSVLERTHMHTLQQLSPSPDDPREEYLLKAGLLANKVRDSRSNLRVKPELPWFDEAYSSAVLEKRLNDVRYNQVLQRKYAAEYARHRREDTLITEGAHERRIQEFPAEKQVMQAVKALQSVYAVLEHVVEPVLRNEVPYANDPEVRFAAALAMQSAMFAANAIESMSWRCAAGIAVYNTQDSLLIEGFDSARALAHVYLFSPDRSQFRNENSLPGMIPDELPLRAAFQFDQAQILFGTSWQRWVRIDRDKRGKEAEELRHDLLGQIQNFALCEALARDFQRSAIGINLLPSDTPYKDNLRFTHGQFAAMEAFLAGEENYESTNRPLPPLEK